VAGGRTCDHTHRGDKIVESKRRLLRATRFLVWIAVWFVGLVCFLWSAGAVYFDFPIANVRSTAAIGLVTAILFALFFVSGQARKLLVVFGVFLIVLVWWRLALKPSNNRPWQQDVAETAWAEINGDDVTLHNVRNCEYRTETDYTPHWETRAVKLSQLAGLDLAITYWGSPYIAHPIVSFDFAEASPVSFSIETRKEVGENYSTIGGFYRQYELIYVCADERDVIRLRTNYRRNEDVYLYHFLAPSSQVRERFLEYLKTLNALHTKPRWYNALTTNCTTAIRDQRPSNERMPWDWRILVNGKGDELLYERHLIATGGLSFPDLKQKSRINERARAAEQDPEFSRRIREAVPGFQ
jgi:Domain of unknown function (DUF4105)